MTRSRGFIVALFLLVVGGTTVLLGNIEEEKPSLSSVMEIWGDVLRDADRFGLQLTRVSAKKEMEIGNKLARTSMFPQAGDETWSPYVATVGKALTPYVRRKGIDYTFQVIDSETINAFALPGGHIYITTGMLDFLQTEAELAAILGHEIAHVDLRHCIEHLQYQLALHKLGLSDIGMLVDVARFLLTTGYSKYQEIEADTEGVRLSIQAGYDPDAAMVVFNRLDERFGAKRYTKARTPVGEIAGVVGEAMGSYFRTHPYSTERARRLEVLVKRNHRRLSGKDFYVGRTNYEKKTSRGQKEFPDSRLRF